MAGIVMKSKVRVNIDRTVYWEWFIVTHPLSPRNEVSRSEAMAYIEDNGLVEVVNNSDGIIWDTPNHDFKRRFRGILSRRDKASLFDTIWE